VGFFIARRSAPSKIVVIFVMGDIPPEPAFLLDLKQQRIKIMANDMSDEPTPDNPRAAHAPEHASTKHERQPGQADPDSASVPTGTMAAMNNRHRRAWQWLVSHKKISIPAAVVVVLAVLFALPFTRYLLAGTVVRQQFSVVVIDRQTGKPVSSASVSLEGKTALTNNQGRANIRTNVGNAKLEVSKKYYKSASRSVLVPLGKQKQATQVLLEATGRQVPITIVNKITGKPVANAFLKALGAEVKTDAHGQATIVLPADQNNIASTVGGNGYNTASVKVLVTSSVDPANTFQITPAGTVYFLSNQSGKIDVVKANLDGTGRQTIIAGTGKEETNNTYLLASTDWKYLALYSKRDGGDHPKLFLIDTSTDKMTTMDEGNADFGVVGWDGDSFIYSVDRTGYSQWQAKAQALKSFNATNSKITVLYETNAGGSTSDNTMWRESSGAAYILGDDVVYSVGVTASSVPGMGSHAAGLYSVKADGSGKAIIKTFTYPLPSAGYYSSVNMSISALQYEPRALDFQLSYYNYSNHSYETQAVVRLENGKVSETNRQTLYDASDAYSTHLVSPSGKQSFWEDNRDGKNTLLVGDANGENGKSIATASDYSAYGWFTDNYLLVSKKGSELYVMSVDGIASDSGALKVSDYYRAGQRLYGYGSGYGGL
jgi:hypothetical protein